MSIRIDMCLYTILIVLDAILILTLVYNCFFSNYVLYTHFIMYWNELNPQKHIVSFKFDDLDFKKDKERGVLVNIKRNIINCINFFFSSSNIHGFSHLTDETKHFTEKQVLIYSIYYVYVITIIYSLYIICLVTQSSFSVVIRHYFLALFLVIILKKNIQINLKLRLF